MAGDTGCRVKTGKTILFLCAGILYLLKNVFHYSPFYINVLNDLLAIPVFLVVMEFLMRKIYGAAFRMSLVYILLTTAVISLLFEVIVPLLSEKAIADPMDVLLYFVGAGLYVFFTTKALSTPRKTLKNTVQ